MPAGFRVLRYGALLLALLALVCLLAAPVVYFVRLNTPSPLVIETTTHEAQIYIAADKTVVAQKWDCITLTWRLQNIRSVYLAGSGTVGEDSREICGLHNPITMTANFHDGASEDFLIPMEFLLPYGLPAQLVVAAVCLLIAAAGVWYVFLMAQYFAKQRARTPQPPPQTWRGGAKWRVTLAVLLLLVLLQAGWRLWHFPNLPLTCCDHTLIPGRTLELSKFPFFSITEFRYTAVGQAFLSRYGIGIYLFPYFVYEVLQILGIPLTNFALHLPAFLYGIIKLPLVFALAYQLTERKGTALLAAALVGVYWEAVVINSTYYGAFPHIIGEMFMLLFAVRWMKYGRFADKLLTVVGMVLVIALHSLFIVSLGLLAVLPLFPPPRIKRRMPWHFFWHARELLPIPALLLIVHALTDMATQMDLGYNNGEGIFLRFFAHTGDGWHPELLFGSGIQYYSLLGWLAFIVALIVLIVSITRTKRVPFELAWVTPYLCLYLINSGLYVVFITPVVGIITAYGLSLIMDRLAPGLASTPVGTQPVVSLQKNQPLKELIRGMVGLGLTAAIFAHSVSYVNIPPWWGQCYKPVAVILNNHFPGRTLSSALPFPAFYYRDYPQTSHFDASNLVLVVDERFQYPTGSENEKSLRLNQSYLAQLAALDSPLPTIATFTDAAGQPVCHLLGTNAEPLGTLSIADLSQQFDAAHTRMVDFVTRAED